MSKRIKLSSHLQHQYLNSDTADIFFECNTESGDCERVPAHKFVLMMSSEVFKSIFCGSSKEEKALYRIDVASAEAFKEFLQLLYFDHVQLTVKNAPQVMDLVQKYQIAECGGIFATLLREHFEKSKVCWGYQLAIFTGQNDLKNLCENQFIWHTDDVFKSDDFFACPRSTLCCILQLDRLSCNEATVFNACITWAKAACERERLDVNDGKHLREQLGYVLYQIRFRSMTFDEFSILLTTAPGLFTAEELEEIIQMMRSNDYKTKIFSGKIRLPTTFSRDPSVLLKCKLEPSQVKGPFVQRLHVENVEKTTFSVTKPLLFGEFACAPMKSQYDGFGIPKSKLKIIEKPYGSDDSKSSHGTVLTNANVTLKDFEAHYMLTKPIQVRPGFVYEIRLEHAFNKMFLKTNIYEQTVKHIDDITVQFHDRYGIVCALYFNR
ncbi:kelch-like ECH-associated protein 1 [Sitodiplosis mosellana]|uniref:kelch-like ECH-associated protein 1 n=1 Tax=Sitodiplosis mosellana TaxID=263140 RepID=UPI0024447642|nr:kelch-like ECH-associated protein 1 [Sitodiplosis mosellana]